MSKQVIAVVGATGNQGGSVVKSLLSQGKFAVRALTRNAAADKAKALQKQGCEVVQCDMENQQDIERAFTGAYGVFGVTNLDTAHGEAGNPTKAEFKQGERIVKAAVNAKVTHFIFSSLDDIEKIDPSIQVHHFTEKNQIEQLARNSGAFKYTTFVYPGYFLSNFQFFGKPEKQTDGTYKASGMLKPDVKLPMVDINEDTGPIVAAAFANPQAYGNGTRINNAREYASLNDIYAKVEKLTGKKITYQYQEPPVQSGNEILEMIRLFNHHGYYAKGKDDLSLARTINPKMGDVEEWMKRTKFLHD
jgi:uncharacterized protein YbjT (DUF2867 family)